MNLQWKCHESNIFVTLGKVVWICHESGMNLPLLKLLWIWYSESFWSFRESHIKETSICHESAMNLPWTCLRKWNEIVNENWSVIVFICLETLPWKCYESAMNLTEKCHETYINIIIYWSLTILNLRESAMNLPWKWHESNIFVTLGKVPWICHEIAMNLPWKWNESWIYHDETNMNMIIWILTILKVYRESHMKGIFPWKCLRKCHATVNDLL